MVVERSRLFLQGHPAAVDVNVWQGESSAHPEQGKHQSLMHSINSVTHIGGHMVTLLFCSLQEFEKFIAKFGSVGFILVALGSMMHIQQAKKVLKVMNAAFAHLSQ